ncbi:chemotaxis-specific protein-glutamate methyltransferase CheB [Nitrosophilus labii]|uniref:chemotaxis-specific protein-glutamate methyltransferase CheB n=1 Tax=Nitrosophilus labii TaxID=2706014 RepID=UPI001656D4EF|nr:chemotaxis-specific protein-glutamate methyltransferase CheB [Nitrosophilus labii]
MAKKALVIDDSALVRRFLSKELQELGFEVDVAKDGEEGLNKALKENYDLITLDIEMPKKDGLLVLEELMREKPTRVIVVSSYAVENGEIALKALDLGALTYITKPGGKSSIILDPQKIKEELKEKVLDIMKISKLSLMKRKSQVKKKVEPFKVKDFKARDDSKYVLIGASTGGPKLIETIAVSLPKDYPYPVCVVQHMPTSFTSKFAERLNSLSKIGVVEAKSGEVLMKGKMIIGKGGKHLHFRKNDDKIVIKLVPNSSGRFFVPSVDEMFFSALEVMEPRNIMAILLTGIGDDGADGMVALKKAGAYTIAESEESATVYGMPKEAYVRGGTVKVLPFEDILKEIIKFGEQNGV